MILYDYNHAFSYLTTTHIYRCQYYNIDYNYSIFMWLVRWVGSFWRVWFLIFGCDSAHCISLWQSQGSVRYSGGAADSWYPLPPWWPVLCGVCGIYNWWFRVGITLHLFWVRFPYWLLYYMLNYHMEWRVVADWVRSFPFMEAHCLRNAA